MSGRSAALLILVACSHAKPLPPPDLSAALRLETRLPVEEVDAGTWMDGEFALRNAGTVPVVFCQFDGGVSITVRPVGASWERPVLLHSFVTDVRCNAETTLQPGEAKSFRERFAIYRDLSGDHEILAMIRVHKVPEDRDPPGLLADTIRAQPFRIHVRPAK